MTNPDCNTCGQTRIYVYDRYEDRYITDPLGYRAIMCPYCSDGHPSMIEVGPKPYGEVFTTCYCCGEDKRRTENHHISYNPEIVKPVCKRCHERIHHDDEFRPDLTPEMKREDAVDAGYIDPGFSETTDGRNS